MKVPMYHEWSPESVAHSLNLHWGNLPNQFQHQHSRALVVLPMWELGFEACSLKHCSSVKTHLAVSVMCHGYSVSTHLDTNTWTCSKRLAWSIIAICAFSLSLWACDMLLNWNLFISPNQIWMWVKIDESGEDAKMKGWTKKSIMWFVLPHLILGIVQTSHLVSFISEFKY